MTLGRFLEVLRSPEGAGSGALTALAEPAPAIAIAPLTVDPAASAPPAAEPAPAAAAAPAEAAPAAAPVSEIPPGLLDLALSKEDAKAHLLALDTPAPAQGAPISGEPAPIAADAGAAPATKGAVEAQPLPQKTYEPFKLPSGYSQSAEGLKQFTDIIGPERLSQEAAQKLVDLAIAEMARAVEADRAERAKYWPALNEKWIADTRKRFGNRLLTALSGAKAVIEDYAVSKEDAAAIIQHMQANGMQNFAPLLAFLDRLASPEVLNVFENSIVPAHAPVTNAKKTITERWYGTTQTNTGA